MRDARSSIELVRRRVVAFGLRGALAAAALLVSIATPVAARQETSEPQETVEVQEAIELQEAADSSEAADAPATTGVDDSFELSPYSKEMTRTDPGPRRDPESRPFESGSVPWFDAEQGTLIPVELPTLGDERATQRESTWMAEPPAPATTAPPTAGTSSFGAFLSSAVSVLMWVLIGTIAVLIVAAVVWVLLKRRRDEDDLPVSRRRIPLDAARVEMLPFDVARGEGDLLAQARAARDAGDLKRAIVLLFAYELLQLEHYGWLTLARGKTNRNYLRELRRAPELGGLLERMIVLFEDAFFGDLSPQPGEFDRCWRELDRFHQLLEARA